MSYSRLPCLFSDLLRRLLISDRQRMAGMGVYSSFLLFAKRAEQKYGVPSHEILLELGRRKTVGGQEDMIEDLALDMARERGINH